MPEIDSTQSESDSQTGTKIRDLLYGENAWQQPSALYSTHDDPLAIHNFKVLVGEPGYNTLGDLDRLLQTMTHIAAAFKGSPSRSSTETLAAPLSMAVP
jgi:AICAR transformylase/IMP cyclohydrolase PurH